MKRHLRKKVFTGTSLRDLGMGSILEQVGGDSALMMAFHHDSSCPKKLRPDSRGYSVHVIGKERR